MTFAPPIQGNNPRGFSGRWSRVLLREQLRFLLPASVFECFAAKLKTHLTLMAASVSQGGVLIASPQKCPFQMDLQAEGPVWRPTISPSCSPSWSFSPVPALQESFPASSVRDRAVLSGCSALCCRSPEPHHRHRAPQCRGACRGDGDLQVPGLQRSPAHQAGVESGQ